MAAAAAPPERCRSGLPCPAALPQSGCPVAARLQRLPKLLQFLKPLLLLPYFLSIPFSASFSTAWSGCTRSPASSTRRASTESPSRSSASASVAVARG